MNEKLMRKAGFNKEMDRVKFNLCPLCKNPIKMEDFKDYLSRKEHSILGMCQKCQDDIFG